MFFITHLIAAVCVSAGFLLADFLVKRYDIPWFFILLFFVGGVMIVIHVMIMDTVVHTDETIGFWVRIFTKGKWHDDVEWNMLEDAKRILQIELWKTKYDWLKTGGE